MYLQKYEKNSDYRCFVRYFLNCYTKLVYIRLFKRRNKYQEIMM